MERTESRICKDGGRREKNGDSNLEVQAPLKFVYL